jgi:sugar-specific transcriptional regulator TrmB
MVAEHIRSAKRSIKIVTGEISSYNYYDLRNAAEEAADRGVKIDVYATSPDRDIINRLIHNGINVYTGQETPNEHFMIIDNKKVIISYKEKDRKIPTPMGDRKGKLTDTPKEVKQHSLMFEKLKKEAIKESICGVDPLQRILNTPRV